MRNLYGLIVSFLFIILVILSAKLFEKAGKEASRKYIHIVLSNWWIIAMVFFDSFIWAMIGPLVFVFVNYFSYKFNLIKSMERDDDQKDGLGTVYYALTLLILSIILFGPLKNFKNIGGPIIGLAGVAVMGYGDAMAAIIGKSVKSPEYTVFNSKKTIAGSLAMLFTTLLIISGVFVYLGISNWFLKAILISVIDTVLEAISVKGTDNLTVPLLTVGMILIII